MKRLIIADNSENWIRDIILYVIDWEDLREKVSNDVEDVVIDIKNDNPNSTDNEIKEMAKEHIKCYIDDCFYTIKYLTDVIKQMKNPPENININLFDKIFKYEGYDGFADYVVSFV